MRRAPGPLNEPARAFDRKGPGVLEVEQQRSVGIVPEAYQCRPSRPPVGGETLKFLERYLCVQEQPRPVFARLEPPERPSDGRRDEDLEASFTGMDEDHGRDGAHQVERLLFDQAAQVPKPEVNPAHRLLAGNGASAALDRLDGRPVLRDQPTSRTSMQLLAP